MEKEGWKTMALVFMSLFIALLIGTTILLCAGLSIVEAEDECMYNICEEADYYTYNPATKVCICYSTQQDEPIRVELIE